MSWCENHDVEFVFGLARNQRLRRMIGQQLWEAGQQWQHTGKPARVFTEFNTHRTRKGWDRERRVVAKAEHIDGKENPRFVVTSLREQEWAARALYEDLYCARGEMENRIKEQFSLFADRVSAETMRANQTAPVSFGDGVCAGQRAAPAGAQSDGTGAGAGVHDPDQAAEDRRAGARERTQSLGFDGLELSLAGCVSAGLDEPALLKRARRKQMVTAESSRKHPARTGVSLLAPRARQQSRRRCAELPHRP